MTRIEAMGDRELIDHLVLSPFESSLIVLPTREQVYDLADRLYLLGIKVRLITDEVLAENREKIVASFEEGGAEVLIITEAIAAQLPPRNRFSFN